MSLRKIAFVCVHNSCRSQIAEAVAKAFHPDFFEPYSAGTELRPRINQDAVRIMKSRFGIDMELTQKSKLIFDLPRIELLVTMGCEVNCPALPAKYRTDWGLEDPSGKPDEAFHQTIDLILAKMENLRKAIEANEIPELLR